MVNILEKGFLSIKLKTKQTSQSVPSI